MSHLGNGKKILLLACTVIVCAAIFYGYSILRSLALEKSAYLPFAWLVSSTADDEKLNTPPTGEISETKSEQQPIELLMGLVIIRDISGKQIARIIAPVVDGGWVALPIRVCLGGYNWKLRLGGKDELTIEGGILNDQDIIGLWRIHENEYLNGPELHPWAEDKPLRWVSLKSNTVFKSVELAGYNKQGMFVQGGLPYEFSESGVFIQDHRIVGWTFGNVAEGGYLWKGDKGKNLTPQISVDDFYRSTFADGREELFILALAMDDNTALERLKTFANGFRLQPKLSQQITPSHLRKSSIIRTMRALIAKLVQEGYSREVVDIFDGQILTEVNHIPLLIDISQARLESYGYENTIQLIEEVREYLVIFDAHEISQLDKIHTQLYQDWLEDLLDRGNIDTARQVYERSRVYFPEDPEIYLFAVRLALANRDWVTAERLLYMKDYPGSLTDRVKTLENRIAELKAEEEKIIIRFEPGSNQVIVDAILNHDVRQKFIVDTGASMVTIPNSTIKDLGINIDEQTPLRQIYTAGGIKRAHEVVLASIELEGQAIYNVKALVVDLPNQPDVGLLGLNYLGRFRMNLNTDEGIFTLEPRYR